MGSPDRILSELLGSAGGKGFAGGVAGGLASQLLLSKAGRKLGKRALDAVAGKRGRGLAAFEQPAQGGVGSEVASLDNQRVGKLGCEQRL